MTEPHDRMPLEQPAYKIAKMKADFLYSSISDIQGTIRSVDVKCGFLFAYLLSPVVVADKVTDFLFSTHTWFVWLAIISTVTLWMLSAGCIFAAVSAISNPADRINGPSQGVYYSGDIFNLSLRNIFDDKSLKSRILVSDQVARLPGTESELVTELAYEQMKLIFIRDVKIFRFNAGVYFAVLTGAGVVSTLAAALI